MKHHSLKVRFALTIAVVYTIVGVLTFLAFYLVTDRIVDVLGTRFASKQALLEKSKLMSAIQRDLTLSIKMADSPLLKEWALNEDNQELKRAALEELESYRKSLKGQSIFFVIDHSLHYYFSDGTGVDALHKPRYTLDPDNKNDAWYFRAMRNVDNFELNIDYDNHLDLNKIWFNVVVKNADGEKIGLGGSGIDITEFISEIVNSDEEGIETILFSRSGAIEGHRNKKYVIHNSKVRGSERKITIFDLMGSERDKARLRDAVESLYAGRAEVETFHLTVENQPYIAAMSHLREIDWFNLVLVDAGQVVSNRDFLPILVITIVSMLALIVIVGFLLNRRVLSPLARLADSTNRIAVGDYKSQIPVQSNDEIGALATCFNDMAKMVKDHRENLEQKVNDRTEELKLSNEKLEASNRQIMDSIRYAQLIQASILPEKEVVERCIKDFFVIYRPRDIVGGDFYFFRACRQDCIIAVIDCTGHGVPGAFMTMTVNAVLNNVLDTLESDNPALILQELNRQMKTALNHDAIDADIDNGLDIGLCWCAPGHGRVVFAGARMDLCYVRQGELRTIAGDKQAIGYRSSDADFTYTNHTVRFGEEVYFFLASDGILDQSGGHKGFGFGRRRLNELLIRLSGVAPADRKAVFEEELALYQGYHRQRDDITVIGFRV